MFPMVTGMNGRRQIFFDCSFATAPASTDQYVATITILADMSANEKLARSVLAAIPDNTTKALILTGGDRTVPPPLMTRSVPWISLSQAFKQFMG